MKAYELIERVKKGGSAENVESERLLDAVKRIEERIAVRAEIKEEGILRDAQNDKEKVLYACGGGVAEGYNDMYEAYLNREACAIREDWDCYGNYDSIFTMRFKELCREIIRGREPKRFSFK